MPTTDRDAQALIYLAKRLRDETHGVCRWDEPGIRATVFKLVGRNLASVVEQVTRHAADPGAKTPGAINRPFLPEPVKPTYRPPMKNEDCRIHAGQWADGCSGCAADALAGDRTTAPDPRRPDVAEQQRAAREALSAVLDGLCRHGIYRRRAVCRECERAETQPTDPSTEGASA